MSADADVKYIMKQYIVLKTEYQKRNVYSFNFIMDYQICRYFVGYYQYVLQQITGGSVGQ